MRARIGVGFAIVALAACGPGGGGDGAAGDARVSRGDRTAFVDACTDGLNVGDAICDCLLDKATTELTTSEFQFLLATVTDDERAAERLRGELGIEGAAKAGTFMVSAPAACARGE